MCSLVYLCICVCVGSILSEASCSCFQVCGSVFAVLAHSIGLGFEPEEAGVGMLQDINPPVVYSTWIVSHYIHPCGIHVVVMKGERLLSVFPSLCYIAQCYCQALKEGMIMTSVIESSGIRAVRGVVSSACMALDHFNEEPGRGSIGQNWNPSCSLTHTCCPAELSQVVQHT